MAGDVVVIQHEMLLRWIGLSCVVFVGQSKPDWAAIVLLILKHPRA